MEPTFFPTPEDFRKWFINNHLHEKELIVGFYKKGSKIDSIDWPQSVDQALCFGWIDGIRRSIDDLRYSIRFTPRRKNSIWSAVNLKRIEELDTLGLLTDAGRKVWMDRNPEKQDRYSFERAIVELPVEAETEFKANEIAWTNWQKMPPSYRKAAYWWVISAKQETTRKSRLQQLIGHSEANERIPSMRPTKGK